MNAHWIAIAGALALNLAPAPARAAGAESSRDTRCYEMRTYHAAPGKFEAMQARFRDHACRLFARHGMASVGYWIPTDAADGAQETLIYILAFSSREDREQKWKSFMQDTEWQAAFKASEVSGRLVAKVESRILQATDFSPAIRPVAAQPERVFELRTYSASKGNLGRLQARFRDHTLKLFEKHGMANVGYWTPASGEPGADDTLIYLLAHANREAAAESFSRFRTDPEWVAARKASEEQAGGALTVPNGVKSVFLKPADYSPMK